MDDRYEVKRFSDGELFLCWQKQGMTEERALDEIRRRSSAQAEAQVVVLGRTVRRVQLHASH